jgi:hypothetical protein
MRQWGKYPKYIILTQMVDTNEELMRDKPSTIISNCFLLYLHASLIPDRFSPILILNVQVKSTYFMFSFVVVLLSESKAFVNILSSLLNSCDGNV